LVIHPLLVHLPLALLLVANLALLWQNFSLKAPPALEVLIDSTLGLGFAGLVLAVATGLFDMQNSPKAQARDGWITIAVIHIVTGVLLLLIFGLLAFRRFVTFAAREQKPHTDRVSMILTIIGLVLLVATGWLGGHLVYEYRVGIK
jgi:uncharacterized membrane protein